MRTYIPLFLLAICVLAAFPVMAAPDPAEKLDQQAELMMKDMDAEEAKQFAVIRTGHGTLRAVEDVQGALDRGIKSCVTNNKDMAKDLNTAWASWQGAINPVLQAGHTRVKELVGAQKFATPKKVNAYLASFDAVIKSRQQGINEVPVSSAEACQDLIKNLEETKALMPKLITETLGLK
jgi:hypothetical protein